MKKSAIYDVRIALELPKSNVLYVGKYFCDHMAYFRDHKNNFIQNVCANPIHGPIFVVKRRYRS